MVIGLPVLTLSAADRPAPKKVPNVERTLAIEFKAPDGGWTAEVEEVWRVQDELVLVVRTHRPKGILAAKMVSTVTAEIKERFPAELPVRGLVLGRTWLWEHKDPGVTFVTEESEEYKARRQGKRLWRKPLPDS